MAARRTSLAAGAPRPSAPLPLRPAVLLGVWPAAAMASRPLRPAVLLGVWPTAAVAPLPLRPAVLSGVWPQPAHASPGGLSFAERPVADSR